MTTSKKLWVGFGSLTSMLILISIAIITRMQLVERRILSQADVARPRSEATRELEIGVVRLALTLRSFALTRDPAQRDFAVENIAAVEKHLADYDRFAGSEKQRELVQRFSKLWVEYRELGKKLLEQRIIGREEALRLLELRAEIEDLLEREMHLDAVAAFDERKQETVGDLHEVGGFAIVLTALGVVIAVLTSWSVGRGIVKAERRAFANAERLRLALEATSMGVWQIDYRTEKFAWSDRCREIFGFPKDVELTREMLYERIHPEDRELVADAAAEAMKRDGDGRFRVEHRIIAPNGEIRWVAARGRAETSKQEGDGEPAVHTGVMVDVTERKRAEEELLEADRRKDEFLATLAHELRNPLAPLRNGLQILNHSKSDSSAAEQARAMMQRQLAQMVRLIDDLLDVSRISRGKIELQRKPVDLAVVIQTAVETSRPLIDAAKHKLAVDLPQTPLVVDADLTRLSQVFANLLNNAAKFMPPGGSIRLRIEQEDGEAVVAVSDAGEGIPPSMLSRVFDIFTQVDRRLERPHGGLGIGLTLVKTLVEMHGGRVEAFSEGPNLGSTFIVRLPLAEAAASQVESHREDCVANGRTGPRRILIADDNTDAAESLAEVLVLMGDEVRTASDGLQAIEQAETFRPQIVLLDIGMPNMNGYDACRRLREQPWGAELTIVAVTGWGQDEDRRRSQDAGFDRHLVKPIAARKLVKTLAEIEAEKGILPVDSRRGN